MGYTACSFTGHRSIESHHKKELPDLLDRAIGYLYDGGCRDFYLGGARGFDTLAAQRVILFKVSHPDVKLHMLLPCQDQDAYWSAREREMYAYTLGCADTVTYLYDRYVNGCMHRRNDMLVSVCDVVVAYHDGKEGGGTAYTVKRAAKSGRRIFNLFPSLNELK